jgi:VanZ family protein
MPKSSTPPSALPLARLRAWCARLLAVATAAYTLVLVFATHYPRPEEFLGANAPPDKALHFFAYITLSLLAASTLAMAGGWSARLAVSLGAGLAAFGIVDEVTQPLFARAAEPFDWVCDCMGIAAGLLLMAVAVAAVRAAAGSMQRRRPAPVTASSGLVPGSRRG